MQPISYLGADKIVCAFRIHKDKQWLFVNPPGDSNSV